MMQRILLFIGIWLCASSAAAAPDGARLYSQHCEACHGQNGQGGVGVPLALPDFLAVADDTFLFKTIRNGRPGRVMPAFTALSDAQVTAIVRHIRSWAPKEPKRPPSYTVAKGNAERGKALYAKHCAACHGPGGEGGHGTGVTFSRPRDLPIIPPALNNPGFQAAASDSMIKATLISGRKGTPMASFLEQGLSMQDIDDIVAHVRTLAGHPSAAPADISPIMEMESPYTLEETVTNIERAAVGRNFRIIRTQKLEYGLFPEEEQDPSQIIIHFCNFNFLNQALALDPRVGLFLPCRITVVEHEGVVKVMSINPRYLGRMFNNAELNAACREMHDTYVEIIEEATL